MTLISPARSRASTPARQFVHRHEQFTPEKRAELVEWDTRIGAGP